MGQKEKRYAWVYLETCPTEWDDNRQENLMQYLPQIIIWNMHRANVAGRRGEVRGETRKINEQKLLGDIVISFTSSSNMLPEKVNKW